MFRFSLSSSYANKNRSHEKDKSRASLNKMIVNVHRTLFKLMPTRGEFQQIKYCVTTQAFELIKRFFKRIALTPILFLWPFPKLFIVTANNFLKDLSPSTNEA